MISRWWQGPNTGGQLWPKDKSVSSFDGTEIRYTLLGPEGAPAVGMCAGFVCPDTYWKYLAPDLADDYRVLVWNYRGIGVSGLPRDPGFHARAIADDELSIEANARDLAAILDEEGIDRLALVGHSMGTQVVFEAYRRFEHRVQALVLIAGPYRTPLRTFYRTDLTARMMPIALPLLNALPRATLLGWRALLRNPLTYPAGVHILRAVGKRAKPEDMKGYFEHLSMIDPLIAAKMIRGMHSHSAEELLPEIGVPVLILHGTADPFTPISVAREMEEAIPDAHLVVLEGGSHTLPIEFPEEIGAATRDFLETALKPS